MGRISSIAPTGQDKLFHWTRSYDSPPRSRSASRRERTSRVSSRRKPSGSPSPERRAGRGRRRSNSAPNTPRRPRGRDHLRSRSAPPPTKRSGTPRNNSRRWEAAKRKALAGIEDAGKRRIGGKGLPFHQFVKTL